ncbi:MAG: AAA family ATPase [Chloroflexi bacterium]|nr:AAA family ATPase [Chloroflexota bacterium]
MADRVIQPPLAELDRLPTPLNDGEALVVSFFHDHLPDGWEIYIQPFLNGNRPDLVLFNSACGVAVFEVKHWDFDSKEFFVDRTGDAPQLSARDHNGRRVRVDERMRNPFPQVTRYRRQIYGLYCPRHRTAFGNVARLPMTAGLIVTSATTQRVRELFEPLRDDAAQREPELYPVAGFNDLRPERIEKVFPLCRRPASQPMDSDLAEDLRGWLREPAFSQEQRNPPELDGIQRRIATTRTNTGLRRVKGPAGSGKSVALAARAAELADTGKRVLVCSYNITLLNYLRDLTRQYARTAGKQRPEIEFVNFHAWCQRICADADGIEKLDRLLTQHSRDELFDEVMPNRAETLLRDSDRADGLPRYDAILVDEGQDFRLNWWSALRAALAEGGEMLLVADKTQNVFGTAKAWTEGAMPGSGFPGGEWMTLEHSYRLPPKMIHLLRTYADEFLVGEDVDIPVIEQGELDMYPVALKWIQTQPQQAVAASVEAVLEQMRGLQSHAAATDVISLGGKRVGLDVVNSLEALDIRVRHTFDDRRNAGRERQLKRQFFQGAERVKATTLHSFKGWEAVQLVVHVSTVRSKEDRAVLYAALTRLKRRAEGSALTVVCSTPDLAEYGRTWPSYEETVTKTAVAWPDSRR